MRPATHVGTKPDQRKDNMKNVLKLAAERAVELAHFSNFSIRLAGEPRIEQVDSTILEDTTESSKVEVLLIPVTVGYLDIKPDPEDLLRDVPEVPGQVMVPVSVGTYRPSVKADFKKLGALRNDWDHDDRKLKLVVAGGVEFDRLCAMAKNNATMSDVDFEKLKQSEASLGLLAGQTLQDFRDEQRQLLADLLKQGREAFAEQYATQQLRNITCDGRY